MKKTIENIEELKAKKINPFNNQYNYLISLIEDLIMTKIGGVKRADEMIKEFDVEAQQYIVEDLKCINEVAYNELQEYYNSYD